MRGYTKPGFHCWDLGNHSQPCPEEDCGADKDCCEHCDWVEDD